MEQSQSPNASRQPHSVSGQGNQRLAVIDIGSNSIRLMVVEPRPGENYKILHQEKAPVRLGKGLSSSGRLDPEIMSQALVGLQQMKAIVDGFAVGRLKAIATSAVRDATNGPDFCRRARDECGLEIEVILAKEEGLLAFSSVRSAFDIAGKPVAVADIGGGSTEVVLAAGIEVKAVYTTQLGAVRLTDMFGNGAEMAGVGFARLVEHIDQHLREHAPNPALVPNVLFGSGGTFTSLAGMVMMAKAEIGVPVRGYQVSRADVNQLVELTRRLPIKERGQIPGAESRRADIIVAGLAVVDRLMHYFAVDRLQIHNRGVRDGLILSMIDQRP